MFVTLVGVGHVFNIGDAVRKIIYEQKPNVVCLELDDDRLTALLTNQRPQGPTAVYRSLSDFQSKMAEQHGTTVGGEMLAAHDAANLLGAETYCIDMNASEFFARAFNSMTLREKIYFTLSSFFARFAGKKKIENEIEMLEQDDSKYIEEFGRHFPSLKRVLIDERNQHMSGAIRKLVTKGKSVVAVVGDGHINGISTLLTDLSPKVIRLKELRESITGDRVDAPAKPGEGNSQVSFSYSFR